MKSECLFQLIYDALDYLESLFFSDIRVVYCFQY